MMCPRLTPRAHRGFTMIEMLVVIAIIVVLVGIVLAVGSAVHAGSDRNRTNATMEILSGALADWEATSGRTVTWGTNGQLGDGTAMPGAFYDMQETTPHIFTVTELLETIGRSSQIKELLAQIDEEHLIRYNTAAPQSPDWLRQFTSDEPDLQAPTWETFWQNTLPNGSLTVLDAWDKPFRCVHPGREWQSGDPQVRDTDGSIRTALEDIYGVCANNRPYFVSSGPDREFGNLQLDVAPGSRDEALLELTLDNIYSYEVIKP